MRKLIVSTFASLDGIMQAPGGPEEDPTGDFTLGGWMFGYGHESMDISASGFDGKDRDLLRTKAGVLQGNVANPLGASPTASSTLGIVTTWSRSRRFMQRTPISSMSSACGCAAELPFGSITRPFMPRE